MVDRYKSAYWAQIIINQSKLTVGTLTTTDRLVNKSCLFLIDDLFSSLLRFFNLKYFSTSQYMNSWSFLLPEKKGHQSSSL